MRLFIKKFVFFMMILISGFSVISSHEEKIVFSRKYSFTTKTNIRDNWRQKNFKKNDRYCQLAETVALVVTKAYKSSYSDFECEEKEDYIVLSSKFTKVNAPDSINRVLLHPDHTNIVEPESDFIVEFSRDIIKEIIDENYEAPIRAFCSFINSSHTDGIMSCLEGVDYHEVYLGNRKFCSLL